MVQQIDYQYIQVPMNLFYLMDANCSKVLTTLVQMNNFYPKEDGYFECAYKTLELACGMSRPVIKASLAGLYLEGIVDVVSVGQGRGKHTNRYKVNVEKFKDYEKINLGIAIMTEDKPIHQVKYKGERFQVPWNEISSEKQSEKGTEKQSEKKVTTNIDNIENIPNIENIDNTKEYNTINNIEDMKVIPIEEKESFYDDSERNLIMVIKEEPTVIKNITPTVNIETPKDDSIFFNEFLDNPTKDYSDLMGDVTSFVRMNITELNILNHKLREYYHQEPSTKYILEKLQFYYLEKINRQYQERTQQA